MHPSLSLAAGVDQDTSRLHTARSLAGTQLSARWFHGAGSGSYPAGPAITAWGAWEKFMEAGAKTDCRTITLKQSAN
jgi:hypothetical protein